MPRRTYIRRANDTRTPAPLPTPATTSVTNSQAWADILGVSSSGNAIYVTESTAAGIPALNYGVTKVSNAVGTMMSRAKTYEGDEEHPSPLIVSRPCPWFGGFEYWAQVARSLVMRGNHVSIVVSRHADGRPDQVVPVHIDSVAFDQTQGVPVYRIGQHDFDASQIVHFRANAPVGSLWGQGIVEVHRKALKGHLAEQNLAVSSASTGGVPSVVIQLAEANPSAERQEAVYDSWQSVFGSGNSRPLISGTALEVKPLSWSPEDAQFLDGRKLSIAEAAYMTGLSPDDLGAPVGSGSSITYANRNDRERDRIVSSYSPWTLLIEEVVSDLLPIGWSVAADGDALIRLSPQESVELELKKIELERARRALEAPQTALERPESDGETEEVSE